jgi:hypothetical protein
VLIVSTVLELNGQAYEHLDGPQIRTKKKVYEGSPGGDGDGDGNFMGDGVGVGDLGGAGLRAMMS